jgi:excisionase family DNA binding protein
VIAATPDVAALLAQVVQLLASAPPTSAPEPRPVAMPNRMLLTVEEAAEQLGIGRTTAWGLVKSGELESVQIGRLRRVHVDAIRSYASQLAAGETTSHG